MFGLRLWATATLWGSAAYAYIPAVGVNDTSSLINSDDLIHIAWLPNGIFRCVPSRTRASAEEKGGRADNGGREWELTGPDVLAQCGPLEAAGRGSCGCCGGQPDECYDERCRLDQVLQGESRGGQAGSKLTVLRVPRASSSTSASRTPVKLPRPFLGSP